MDDTGNQLLRAAVETGEGTAVAALVDWLLETAADNVLGYAGAVINSHTVAVVGVWIRDADDNLTTLTCVNNGGSGWATVEKSAAGLVGRVGLFLRSRQLLYGWPQM